MFLIGCHVSASKGYVSMGETAHKLGGNTFQFFTRNPRGGTAKALDLEDIAAYNTFAKEHHFGTIVAHAPYTLNACAADESLRTFAENVMREDLERLSYVDNVVYNFHPGSHVKQGEEIGIAKIAELLNRVVTHDTKTMVLLETMAGKGTEIGKTFEQLADIISRVHASEKIGVCLDTCHVFDGGYDIVHALDDVLLQFEQTIGLSRLHAIHLNDSKNTLGSHKDRHEVLQQGGLGTQTIINIINHPKLHHLPFVLETPNDEQGYAKEIAWLKTVRNV